MLTDFKPISHRNTQRLRSAHEPRPRRRQGNHKRYARNHPSAHLSHFYQYSTHPSRLLISLLQFYGDLAANRNTDDEGNTSSRPLGLLVARGTLLVLISPLDGSEEIPNPFVQAEEGEGAAAI
jgi:hypothetical protein